MTKQIGAITIFLAVLCIMPSLAGADETSKAEQRALFRQGAQLWPQSCGACHKARPGGERSPSEWETIMMHMRVRANLPGQHARAILHYLKSR